MTNTPVFPVLPGLGWSVHKKPTFASLIAPHVSGREARAAQYINPIWQFELGFEGLDGTTSGVYGGLGAKSLQALMGLFLQCQGQYAPFVYYDPTDYAVTAQAFGTGDGTTTTFPLKRMLGGFSEQIIAPFAPASTTLFNLPGSTLYAPNNLLAYSQDMTQASWGRNLTATSGVSDPLGGTGAQTLTSTAAWQYSNQGLTLPVGNSVSSFWARRRAGTGAVGLTSPGGSVSYLPLTSSWQRFSSSAAAPAGWGVFGFTLQASGDAVDVYGAQLEQSTTSTLGPYFQTAATQYFGGPWITRAGILVDPSNYSIANGLVTFNTAPANGAALTWTGYFGFLCRFDDDSLDFEQFMQNLWRVDSLKFRSVRAQ